MKEKEKEFLYYTCAKIAELPVIIVASDKGITWIDFTNDASSLKDDKHFEFKEVGNTSAKVFGLPKQLREYFTGKRKKFEVPIDIFGTHFQLKVWKALLKINYGHLKSYKDIAKAVELPAASRAVGNAIGANPVPILIPCHRVIASDGTLGGYSGGIDVKIKLLDIEEKYVNK